MAKTGKATKAPKSKSSKGSGKASKAKGSKGTGKAAKGTGKATKGAAKATKGTGKASKGTGKTAAKGTGKASKKAVKTSGKGTKKAAASGKSSKKAAKAGKSAKKGSKGKSGKDKKKSKKKAALVFAKEDFYVLVQASLFFQADADDDGKVTVEELVDFVVSQGVPREEAYDIFVEYDRNNDGELSLDEFASLWTVLDLGGENEAHLTEDKIDAVKNAYAAFDTDGDGMIDISEMQSVAKLFFTEDKHDRITEEAVRDMIAQVDLDADAGTLSFPEFLAVMAGFVLGAKGAGPIVDIIKAAKSSSGSGSGSGSGTGSGSGSGSGTSASGSDSGTGSGSGTGSTSE